jgi:predicted membrane-bound spermidine synthase
MVNYAALLSLAVGFLSLSQEIIWVRIISFILQGIAQSFPLVLFCFLFGLAVGAAIGKRLCKTREDLWWVAALVLTLAAAIDLGLILLLPPLVQHLKPFGLGGLLALVTLTALLKSILFPIAHHIGSQQKGAFIGRSVARVYFFNIIGSTLGPIITGYVLLDYLTVEQCLLVVGMATSLLALACSLPERRFAVALLSATVLLPVGIMARLSQADTIPDIARATQKRLMPGKHIGEVIQNRHGIIYTVIPPDGEPAWTFGGNVYDGRLTVDIDKNVSRLDRALVALAVHPNPERVLVIGLSTGAWARILTGSPRIKEMTAVEINPGYLAVINKHPEIAGLLADPRVYVLIDDGRRWLKRNPDQGFDLIVLNTTFYWRTYATNLLSREFMEQVKKHLNPGGIAMFNTTSSGDVLATALRVFPFVERRDNFVYGSNGDFSLAIEDAEQVFREMQLDGKPVFSEAAFAPGGIARNIIDTPFVPHANQYLDLTPNPMVITDQNLLTEQAHGRAREKLPRFYGLLDQMRLFLDQGKQE